MARLELDAVTKVFEDEDSGEDVVAVEDATVDIEDGEFVVLVGPSGCGKSTTLRMIAGLETVTDGEIRLGGEVINDRTPQERDIAMVFQSYALYPHKTTRGNMSFGLEEATDLSDEEIAGLVEETAAMMGIEDLLDRKPGQLSGGQQQRVALGRAIVRDPEVFLMDEPLSNLDAKLRAQMRTELQQLQSRLGVTTVYVTHDQTEAMTMGDRMVVMNDGRLQQVGEPLELYHEPANTFVAEFIGDPSINFVHGRRSGSRFVGDDFEHPFGSDIVDAIDETVADGDGLVFGVRPEDIVVQEAAHTASPGDHEHEMEVLVVEPMGDENVVHLGYPGSDDGSDLVAVTDGTRSVEEGSTVTIEISDDVIHLFDPGTGEAIHNRRLRDESTVRRV